MNLSPDWTAQSVLEHDTEAGLDQQITRSLWLSLLLNSCPLRAHAQN